METQLAIITCTLLLLLTTSRVVNEAERDVGASMESISTLISRGSTVKAEPTTVDDGSGLRKRSIVSSTISL